MSGPEPAGPGWAIAEVGLRVHDLGRAATFYGEIVGLGAGEGGAGGLRFRSGGQALWLHGPDADFARANGLTHNPLMEKCITLGLADPASAARRLAERGVASSEAAIPGATDGTRLFCHDPGMNLIAFTKAGAAEDAPADWNFHHVNLQAYDVRASVGFYVDVAGMEEAAWIAPPARGDFSIDPSELAVLTLGRENRGLHVIRPDPGFALRNGFAHNPSVGGHPAFNVPDIRAVMRRLDTAGVPYSDAGTYAMHGFHQVYVFDPSWNMIEINQTVG